MEEFQDLPSVNTVLKQQYASYAAQLADIYKSENDMPTYFSLILTVFQYSSDDFKIQWLKNKELELNEVLTSKDMQIGHAILYPLRKAKRLSSFFAGKIRGNGKEQK